MDAQLAYFAIDVATAFSAALLCLRVLTERPRLPAAQLVAAIAFNTVCDVILGRSDYSYWIPSLLRVEVHGGLAIFFNLARNSTPFLFAALCHALYADRRRFPRWLYALLAIQLFLEEPARLTPDIGTLLTQTAPALLETFFVAVALYWTVADWCNDLIEARRRTRILTSIAIGLSVIASGLGLRVLIAPDTMANYHAHVATTVSHLVLVVFVLFQMTRTGIDVYLDPLHRPVPMPQAAVNPDAAALARLAALMESEHLYRRPGLTLAGLAGKASVPEYRLRRMIHEQLGFANFNVYLHAWRIREACEQLRDPAQRRTPILTIALSVGYQSVNTFNRGFREVMNTTPSAWRADEGASLPPPPKTA